MKPANRYWNRFLSLSCHLALGGIFCSAASAGTNWTGTTDQVWNTATNWGGALPGVATITINVSTGNFPIITAASAAAFKPIDVAIGNATGNTGRLDVRSGTLVQNTIGTAGNWVFVGGAATNAVGGTGTLNLADTSTAGAGISGFAQGSGALTIGKLWVGGRDNNTGTGTVNINTTGIIDCQSTGLANANNASLIVGAQGSTGTLNLESGTIQSAGNTLVGRISGTGNFTMSSGTLTTGGVQLAMSTANTNTAKGTMTLSGGTVTSSQDVVVGLGGNTTAKGYLILNGGTFNVGTTAEKWMKVGAFDTVAGQLDINTGATLNLNFNTDIRFTTDGGTGTSVINQNGGNVVSYSNDGSAGAGTLGGATVLDFNRAGSTGTTTYNLNGGTLAIAQVMSTVNNGTRTFNFNGGTLKVASNATAATFFNLGATGTPRANVRNGGAIIDTNGIDVTMAQIIDHSNVGGDDAKDGGLTKNGTGTLTLSGTSTFTGDLTINAGTVAAGTGQGAAPAASNLGALQPAANRNITINNGGTLSLTGGNVLGTGASTNTLANNTIIVNSGGLLRTGLDGANAGWWNKVGNLTLNGGSVRVGGGANNNQYQALALIGAVSVTGSTACTIDTFAASTPGYTGIHLGQNAGAGQSIPFDVADVTGNSNTDLTITPPLLNTSNSLAASGLTKNGAGTMTLTGASAYTGATVINAGTLQLGDGTTDGTIATTSGVSGNGALVFNRVGSSTATYPVSGGISVTKTGAGSVTLAGADTYSGATQVSGGTLNFTSNAHNLGSSAFTVVDSAGLGTKTFNNTTTVLTTASLAMGTAGTTNLSVDFNNLNPTAPAIATGALTVNGTLNVSITNGAQLTSGLHPLVDYTTLSGTAPTGTFVLGPRSNGSLVNDTVNTVLNLDVTANFPKWTGLDNGIWAIGSTGANSNWKLTTGGAATDYLEGDVVLFDDSVTTGTTDVTIDANVTPAGVTINNTSKNYTFSGGAGISGTGSLTKNGSGDVVFGTINTYTGGTFINAGTLNITGSLADTGAVTVSGGTYKLTENDTVGAVTLTSGSIIDAGFGATLTGSSYAVQSGSISVIIDGLASTLTKTTTGTVTVSSATNYAGATTVNEGTLTLTGAINNTNSATAGQVTVGNLAGATSVFNINGGTINAKGGNFVVGSAATTTATVNMTGGTVDTGTRELWLSSINGANSTLNLSGGTLTVGNWLAVGRGGNDGHLNVSGGNLNVTGGNLTFASFNGNVGQGEITGGTVTTTNAVFVGEAGTGTLTVSTGGSLVINGATGLRITNAASGTGTASLNAGGTITAKSISAFATPTAAIFNLDGGTLKAGASSGTWYAANANLLSQVRSGGAIIDTNGFDVTIADVLAHETALGATLDGGLVKNGAGTLAVTSANTFTGAVVVNAGTLYANPGTAANNRAFSFVSSITVNNGATLQAGANGLFGSDGTQEKTITVNAGGTLTADGVTNSDVGVGTVILNGGTLASNASGADDYGSFRFDQATDKLQVTENSTISAYYVKFGNPAAQLEVAAGKTATVTGTITDTTLGGISHLNKTGAGTLTLGSGNSYSGNTTVAAGTLIESANSATTFADTSTVTIASGAVLNLPNAATDEVASLVINNVALPNGIYDASTPATATYITGNGKIQVGHGGYATWASANAAPGETAKSDHDNDGTQNGVEFFMGGTKDTMDALPGVVNNAGTKSVTWTKSASFTGTYEVQVSPDLLSWSPAPNGTVTDNGTSVKFTFPAGPTIRFARLMVNPQ